MTQWGAVAFTDITGELVDAAVAERHYPGVAATDDTLVWAQWRKPSHDELVRTWPARAPADATDQARGWWQPTLQELRSERRKAASAERASETRRSGQDGP